MLRSQGTQFTIGTWQYLNSTWPQFGNTPVQIDYWSLAAYHWTYDKIAATGANVLILSCPGYNMYFPEEIEAVRQYVEAGHGLIITYGNFRSEDRALAPLVGLTTATSLGTNTWPDPFAFDVLAPDHPLFAGLSGPYVTASPYLASPASGPLGGWYVGTGVILAEARPTYHGWSGYGIIVANDAGAYRGLYIPHYIELGNLQDMQVLYNAILWAPEPGTACLMIVGAAWLLRRGPAGRRR